MLIANKSFRFISLLLAAVLVLAGITFLQVASSSPAHAADESCASSGACQDIGTDIGLQIGSVAGGGLGRPVVVGPVLSAPPPAVPETCRTTPRSWCAPNYKVRSTFYKMPKGWTGIPLAEPCFPKMISGIKVYSVGYTLVERADLISWLSYNGPVYSYWRTIVTLCNYPPDPTITNTNIQCILSYNANIDRLANSYLGYGARVGSKSQTISSISALENNPGGCQTSISANFGTNVGRNQTDYGWYQATSSVTWARCTFGYTTFDGTTTRTGGCSNAGTRAGSVGKLTVYCGPAIKDWVALDWTGKDCYPSGPKCTVPNTSKFNGFMGNVQALRDGNDNNMTWANPVFTAGISGAGNWRTKTDINAGSTPFKAGVGPNDKTNQMFRSNQNFGTWNYGSLATLQDQKLAFYTSGSSGSPFQMTRNYLFDANFTTVATTVTGYNVTTGAMSTANSSTTVYLRNNPCGPQTSPRINAVRAIGDVLTG
jgi:hypothetical protein